MTIHTATIHATTTIRGRSARGSFSGTGFVSSNTNPRDTGCRHGISVPSDSRWNGRGSNRFPIHFHRRCPHSRHQRCRVRRHRAPRWTKRHVILQHEWRR